MVVAREYDSNSEVLYSIHISLHLLSMPILKHICSALKHVFSELFSTCCKEYNKRISLRTVISVNSITKELLVSIHYKPQAINLYSFEVVNRLIGCNV